MAAPRAATSTETSLHLGKGGERGLYLGRFVDDAGGRLGGKLVYSSERHAILFGPNGSGKGVRFLMPNLLGDYLADRTHSATMLKSSIPSASCSRRPAIRRSIISLSQAC
jgi:hypothetical protein